MDPPSYEEARNQVPGSSQPPPPSYNPSPPTPPPSYREAVHSPPDPFPVLTPPVVPAAATPQPQNIRPVIHPVTQIGPARPVNSRRTPAVAQVVVTQPQAVPVQIQRLTNIPALVQCPFCRQTVVTKVTCAPGPSAWFLCVIIALTGLICGFCLIPFMVPSLQESRHSCPQCKAHLFTYRR
ncbi:lipopolysaccharide-induced tumor necrosis factor-alpha factor homolog [Betta splendens]|uniref:Lipopolysaccharide-induced tumor necrosis factor-alpha factor homolog n=1 Tax=Betta splendens TaxID=158456 RepID=A0A6P7M5D4_BETSP|nr:lipopolysaccharide-induced tumor necrosis factor-alpha factor homolog [Betta splendens]XP_055365314.1 lipopolysaccharide-induced tumor necrosis factor-alpha factor homolog [Betta splendens]